jgi:hypothetical protein
MNRIELRFSMRPVSLEEKWRWEGSKKLSFIHACIQSINPWNLQRARGRKGRRGEEKGERNERQEREWIER